MPLEQCVVDNRVFLLGLDTLYRDAMRQHERAELLLCARTVAAALEVPPADVPVEGYYADDQRLTDYFRLVRALQAVDERRAPEVAGLPQFHRLRDVTSAPLYGRPQPHGRLLPAGRDALSHALLDTRPAWTVERLTAAAHAAAHATDDISLVGLAARTRDPVVLAALRESVVLYAEAMVLGMGPDREFVWQVDDELAEQAGRFLHVFTGLFGEELPPPGPQQAEEYWHAFEGARVVGRCARLGYDDTRSPVRHYHWAIRRDPDGRLTVHEFWHPEVWTTERYRAALDHDEERPDR